MGKKNCENSNLTLTNRRPIFYWLYVLNWFNFYLDLDYCYLIKSLGGWTRFFLHLLRINELYYGDNYEVITVRKLFYTRVNDRIIHLTLDFSFLLESRSSKLFEATVLLKRRKYTFRMNNRFSIGLRNYLHARPYAKRAI